MNSLNQIDFAFFPPCFLKVLCRLPGRLRQVKKLKEFRNSALNGLVWKCSFYAGSFLGLFQVLTTDQDVGKRLQSFLSQTCCSQTARFYWFWQTAWGWAFLLGPSIFSPNSNLGSCPNNVGKKQVQVWAQGLHCKYKIHVPKMGLCLRTHCLGNEEILLPTAWDQQAIPGFQHGIRVL